ncbi:hypothetical protein [Nocardia sp. NPDC057440]
MRRWPTLDDAGDLIAPIAGSRAPTKDLADIADGDLAAVMTAWT